MKTKILLLFLFCWVAVVYGQSEEEKEKAVVEYIIKENHKSHKKKIITKTNRGVDSTRTKTYEVEYDFVTGVFNRNRNRLEVNSPVVFKISNINRFAYKTNIVLRDSSLAESFIEEFVLLAKSFKESEAAKTETPKNTNTSVASGNNDVTFGKDDISGKVQDKDKDKTLKEVNEIPKLQSLIQLRSSRIDSVKNSELEIKILEQNNELRKIELDKIIKDQDQKIANKKQENILLTDSEEKVNNQKEIEALEIIRLRAITEKEEFNKESATIKKIKDDIELIKKRILADNSKIKELETNKQFALKKFETDSRKFIESYGELESSYKKTLKIRNYYKEIINISGNSELTYEFYCNEFFVNLRSMLYELKLVQFDISEYEIKSRDLQKYYDYMKYNPELSDVLDFGGMTKLYSYVEKLKVLADQMNENVKANNYDDMVRHIQQAVPLLEKRETYYEVSIPIQPMRDIVVFDVDIKKRDNAKNDLDRSKKFRYKEFTYGGIRFDLGLGIAGSWFPNVKKYEMKQETDSVKILQQAKQTYSPAFVGLFTASFRNTRYTTYGFSAGMGLAFEDDKIQLNSFYVGPSIILGKYDRITITAGVTMKNVEVLRQGYNVESSYPSQNKGEDLLTKEYRAGMFLSLTYNLTKGVRDNVKYLSTLVK